MPNIPEATSTNRWTIEGLKGEFEKIKKSESKKDGNKDRCVTGIYGDGSLGYYLPVPIEDSKKVESPSVAATSSARPRVA